MNVRFIFISLVLVIFSHSSYAQDIKSNTKGFSLNINGVYGAWNSESQFLGDLDDLEPDGLGISAKAAYGINQNIEILLGFSTLGYKQVFEWDQYRQSVLELGGRYNFGATLRRIRPFLEASLAFNSVGIDPITFDGINVFFLESSGVGVNVGGGLHFFLTQSLSINANGKLTFGNFSDTSLSGSPVDNLTETLDFTNTSLHIGLTYFFQ